MIALVVALLLAAPPSKKKSEPEVPRRELVRRSIAITDSTREVEVHVAGGSPTTLVFPQNIAKYALVDAKGYFPAANQQRAGRLFILLPDKDVREGDAVTLQLTLEDGTLLPPLLLTSVPTASDLHVEMAVQLQQRASSESAVALKSQVTELQSKLDECQQSGGDRGASKVAELVLRQDFRKPVAFVVEKHPARRLDKQSRLLVEAHHVYRLFDVSYLVLTIENRDPDKLWVLERAEIALTSGSSNVEARVLDVAQEMSQGVPPGEEAKLVVSFKTPEQSADHQFTLRLLEKAGNRHVELDGLKL
ncbi:MAG: DUF2381 family protein [Archangium sp.]